jgi:hypothetical protein
MNHVPKKPQGRSKLSHYLGWAHREIASNRRIMTMRGGKVLSTSTGTVIAAMPETRLQIKPTWI